MHCIFCFEPGTSHQRTPSQQRCNTIGRTCAASLLPCSVLMTSTHTHRPDYRPPLLNRRLQAPTWPLLRLSTCLERRPVSHTGMAEPHSPVASRRSTASRLWQTHRRTSRPTPSSQWTGRLPISAQRALFATLPRPRQARRGQPRSPPTAPSLHAAGRSQRSPQHRAAAPVAHSGAGAAESKAALASDGDTPFRRAEYTTDEHGRTVAVHGPCGAPWEP